MRNVQLGILVAAALAALLPVSPAARADGLVFEFQSVISASAGSTGNVFDVLLENTGPSVINVAAFAYEITTSDTDISFTGADTSTTAPYIYAGDSFVDINGFTLYTGSLGGQTLEASDLSNSGVDDNLGSGASVGVGRIFFDVAPGAATGPFAVNFVAYPFTSLANSNANNLDFTVDVGTITITNAAAVPEPAEGELVICGLAMADSPS